MVSVIIPVYNAEMVIGRCIDSFLRQTYTNFEIIVIDDGSTDQTAAVVTQKLLYDSRIHLIRQKNLGVSAARNKGIEASGGEFICFADSDDTVSENFIEVLLSLYNDNVMPVIDVMRSDKAGSALLTIAQSCKLEEDWEEKYFCGDLGQKIAFSVWNKLFFTKLIKEKNIKFSENISVSEDMLFVYEYLRFCQEIHFSKNATYHYTIVEGSAMNSSRDYLAQYEMTLVEMQRKGINELKAGEKIISQWSFNSAMIVMTNPYIAKKTYSEFNRWWKMFSATKLYKAAITTKEIETRKRKMIYQLMRSGRVEMLYLLLKAFYRRKQKRVKRTG